MFKNKNKIVLYICQTISNSSKHFNSLIKTLKMSPVDISIEQFNSNDELINTIDLSDCRFKSTNYNLDYSTGEVCIYKLELNFEFIKF